MNFICESAEFNGAQCAKQCRSCAATGRPTPNRLQREITQLANEIEASGLRGYARRLRAIRTKVANGSAT